MVYDGDFVGWDVYVGIECGDFWVILVGDFVYEDVGQCGVVEFDLVGLDVCDVDYWYDVVYDQWELVQIEFFEVF